MATTARQRATRTDGAGTTEFERAALRVIARAPGQTSRSLARSLQVSRPHAQTLLRGLTDRGLVRRELVDGGEYAHALAGAAQAAESADAGAGRPA